MTSADSPESPGVVDAFHPVGGMPLWVRRGGIHGIGEEAEGLIRALLATFCLAWP
jgi:hypothetical protein